MDGSEHDKTHLISVSSASECKKSWSVLPRTGERREEALRDGGEVLTRKERRLTLSSLAKPAKGRMRVVAITRSGDPAANENLF
jgi:hypothetical protein